MRHLLSMHDLDRDEVLQLLDTAASMHDGQHSPLCSMLSQ